MPNKVTEPGRTRVGPRSALAVAIGLGVIGDVSVLLLITWPAGALVSFLFGCSR